MSAAELAKVLEILQDIVDAPLNEPIPPSMFRRALEARGNILYALSKVRVEVTA